MSRIAARLERAEGRVGMGARCAYCRLSLRSTWQGFDGCTQVSDTKDERIIIQCHFCNTQYHICLPASWPEWKRDVVRLSRTYKEDEFYTDKKAAAVRLYSDCFGTRLAARRASSEKLTSALARFNPELKPKSRANPPAPHEQQKPLSKTAKLRQALIAEYIRDMRDERRAMRKKYGRRFPELDALACDLTRKYFFYLDHQKPDIEGDDYLKHLRAWAILETAIWNAPLPHTIEEIAEHERALARLAAAIDEREQKRQEERDERERERLARIEAARRPAPDTSQPAENWMNRQEADANTPYEPAEWLKRLEREYTSLASPEELKVSKIQNFPSNR